MLQEKYEILRAHNGEEGLQIIRKDAKELSLVLLDLMMPIMDGFTVLKNKSAEKRIANDEATNKDYIKDNTDFNNIIEQKELYFYQMDLLQYAEKLKSVGKEYRNSTPNWEELYRATIVAPIKIANRRAHDTDKESEYAVTGFLCIDSMNTHIFVPAQKDYYIKILKSYASLLYTLFSLYRDILKETT